MPKRTQPSLPSLPEILDPEWLPVYPLARYYIADCPFPRDEFDEPFPWVEAESAVVAALMAQTLYGPNWGRFALLAWRDSETNEICRFVPNLDEALAMLQEVSASRTEPATSQRTRKTTQPEKGKEQP